VWLHADLIGLGAHPLEGDVASTLNLQDFAVKMDGTVEELRQSVESCYMLAKKLEDSSTKGITLLQECCTAPGGPGQLHDVDVLVALRNRSMPPGAGGAGIM
jgi:hypothetical protein